MATTEASITRLMIVCDYDPIHYINWSDKEKESLGNCKEISEIIMKRLKKNGINILEMYSIEHSGENYSEISQLRKSGFSIFHDKKHFHIALRISKSTAKPIKEIAKYIGLRSECIEKPHRGNSTFEQMLSYLIHIKYDTKLQYAPTDVCTLVGTDYLEHYEHYHEKWLKARERISKSTTLEYFYNQAKADIENGLLTYNELSTVDEYRPLILDAKYRNRLKKVEDGVAELARLDSLNLYNMLRDGSITLEEINADPKYKAAILRHEELQMK